MVPTSSTACQDLAWLVVVGGLAGGYIARSASFGTEVPLNCRELAPTSTCIGKTKFVWVKRTLWCCPCGRAANIPDLRTRASLPIFPCPFSAAHILYGVSMPAQLRRGLKLSKCGRACSRQSQHQPVRARLTEISTSLHESL